MHRFVLSLMVCLLAPAAALPDQPFAAILGQPGVPDEITRLPQLPIALAFNRDGNEIIARQQDGAVMGWSLNSGQGRLLAQTDGAFAYCARLDRMVIGSANTAVLLSLADGGYANLSEGTYDHAAFSADCHTLALAESDTAAVEIWTLDETPRLRTIATLADARNGLALSDDGAALAVSTGDQLDTTGRRTTVEIFRLNPPAPTRSAMIALSDTIVGLWTSVFTPRRALIIGTQRGAKAGLASYAADGALNWSWDAFPAPWVRAIAASPDGLWVLSGDDAGNLILWDAVSGDRGAHVNVGQVIKTAAFSADGALAAIALWDGTIAVLRVSAFVAEYP